MKSDLYDIALKNLQSIWGFDSFREGQEEAIRSILNGKQTLVLFPTGGGKSLCYQIPAIVLEGLTVVISPLIALMQDQVDHLKSLGISATFINSTTSSREIEQRLINARNGMYKLLYCSPERLETPVWQYEVNNLNISLIAVDEAHCISEWGHDFRPMYRKIRSNFDQLTHDVRWLALTATATPEVRDDIVEQLRFDKPAIISRGFDRPNLHWWVIETEQKNKKLLELVEKAEKGSGLIYASTRRKTKEIADYLQHIGISAEAYHAGLDLTERKVIQDRWQRGELAWVVATSAFGMGIDKADCRYVFHYELPQSLEAYYQQAGRAGRDGKKAYPVLLFNNADYRRIKGYITQAYPGRDVLQKVYDALCDSLQLAVGSEQKDPEQIDLKDLSIRNKLSVSQQRKALRLMNQLGMINLISEFEPHIGLLFPISYQGLLDYIKELKNRNKSNFIDQLFRLFGPSSLEERSFIELKKVLEKMRLTRNQLIKGLRVLQQEQILSYEVREYNPLVSLNEPRWDKFPFAASDLEHHRNILLEKLDYLLGYVHTDSCRSVYINQYFGDQGMAEDCGHCDLCMKRIDKKESVIKSEEIRDLASHLKESPRKFEFLKMNTGWNENKLRKLLQFMIRENIVEVKTDEPDVFYLIKRDSNNF